MSFRQSKIITNLRNKIPHTIVNNILHYPIALGATIYYNFPARKLTIIGVTGSNGKTTTVTGIHHLLQLENIKTGMISTIKAKIETKEIEVKTVSSGQEALDALEKASFDLIILDMFMPEMSGRVVLE